MLAAAMPEVGRMCKSLRCEVLEPALHFADQCSLWCRFVDPNDPTQLYLASPVADEQRLTEQPKYAAEYGKAEAQYQDMNIRP